MNERSKSMKLPNDEIVHYKSVDGVTAIAEFSELVRCKDCKFYDTDNDTGFPLCRRLGDIVMKPTDYCSYGELKEQEHE